MFSLPFFASCEFLGTHLVEDLAWPVSLACVLEYFHVGTGICTYRHAWAIRFLRIFAKHLVHSWGCSNRHNKFLVRFCNDIWLLASAKFTVLWPGTKENGLISPGWCLEPGWHLSYLSRRWVSNVMVSRLKTTWLSELLWSLHPALFTLQSSGRPLPFDVINIKIGLLSILQRWPSSPALTSLTVGLQALLLPLRRRQRWAFPRELDQGRMGIVGASGV